MSIIDFRDDICNGYICYYHIQGMVFANDTRCTNSHCKKLHMSDDECKVYMDILKCKFTGESKNKGKKTEVYVKKFENPFPLKLPKHDEIVKEIKEDSLSKNLKGNVKDGYIETTYRKLTGIYIITELQKKNFINKNIVVIGICMNSYSGSCRNCDTCQVAFLSDKKINNNSKTKMSLNEFVGHNNVINFCKDKKGIVRICGANFILEDGFIKSIEGMEEIFNDTSYKKTDDGIKKSFKNSNKDFPESDGILVTESDNSSWDGKNIRDIHTPSTVPAPSINHTQSVPVSSVPVSSVSVSSVSVSSVPVPSVSVSSVPVSSVPVSSTVKSIANDIREINKSKKPTEIISKPASIMDFDNEDTCLISGFIGLQYKQLKESKVTIIGLKKQIFELQNKNELLTIKCNKICDDKNVLQVKLSFHNNDNETNYFEEDSSFGE